MVAVADKVFNEALSLPSEARMSLVEKLLASLNLPTHVEIDRLWPLEPKAGKRVKDVRVTDDAIAVDLFDGRTITVPLAWYPRLLHATSEQRANWRIAGAGYGIHWPDIDEDLSTQGLLQGAPAPPKASKAA